MITKILNDINLDQQSNQGQLVYKLIITHLGAIYGSETDKNALISDLMRFNIDAAVATFRIDSREVFKALMRDGVVSLEPDRNSIEKSLEDSIDPVIKDSFKRIIIIVLKVLMSEE